MSWEEIQKKAAKDLAFYFYTATGHPVVEGEEDEKAFYEAYVQLRSTTLETREQVYVSNLQEILNQIHDQKLSKLSYKKRFESLANAISNEIAFHKPTNANLSTGKEDEKKT